MESDFICLSTIHPLRFCWGLSCGHRWGRLDCSVLPALGQCPPCDFLCGSCWVSVAFGAGGLGFRSWVAVYLSEASGTPAGLSEWSGLCGSAFSAVAGGAVRVPFTHRSLFSSLAFSSCISSAGLGEYLVWSLWVMEMVTSLYPVLLLSDTFSHLAIRLRRYFYFMGEDSLSVEIIRWNEWD